VAVRKLRALALISISLTVMLVVGFVYVLPYLHLRPAASAEPVASAPLETKAGELITFDFVTPSVGWAAATESVDLWIFGTTDGAKDWTRLSVIAGVNAQASMHFFDRVHGRLSVEDVRTFVYYRTADGGRSWTQITLPDTTVINVGFSDQLHGWATTGGIPSRLYLTGDGGVSWAPRPDLPVDFAQAVFRDSDEGWLDTLSANYGVYGTTDGGRTWQTHQLPAPFAGSGFPAFASVMLLPKRGVAVLASAQCNARVGCPTFGDAMFLTFDRGLSWLHVPEPPGGGGYSDIAFQDDLRWWVIRGNTLYKTADAGQSWKAVSTRVLYDHVTAHILDPAHAWTQQIILDDSQPNRRSFSATELDMTSDGGLTWKTVPVPVPG
jgi:photosystem II stability/assembly factor-like uncharacterized protein